MVSNRLWALKKSKVTGSVYILLFTSRGYYRKGFHCRHKVTKQVVGVEEE